MKRELKSVICLGVACLLAIIGIDYLVFNIPMLVFAYYGIKWMDEASHNNSYTKDGVDK